MRSKHKGFRGGTGSGFAPADSVGGRMLACFCAHVFACVVSSREWAEADMSKCTQKSAAKETETCASPPALARERVRSEWAPFF